MLAAFAAALVLSFLLGLTAGAVLLLGLLYVASSAILFVSRRGVKAILRVQDSALEGRAEEQIAACRRIRDRISYLRLSDARVIKAVEYLLLVSGEMLEACARERRFVPRLQAELEDSLAACTDYMESADAAANERRYGGQSAVSAEAVDESGATDAAAAAAAFIRRSAGQLSEIRESEFPRLPDGRDIATMREIDEP